MGMSIRDYIRCHMTVPETHSLPIFCLCSLNSRNIFSYPSRDKSTKDINFKKEYFCCRYQHHKAIYLLQMLTSQSNISARDVDITKQYICYRY